MSDLLSNAANGTSEEKDIQEWIYNIMQKYRVSGWNFLFIGSRNKKEVEFFKEKGFSNITAINISESDEIRSCNISKMAEDEISEYGESLPEISEPNQFSYQKQEGFPKVPPWGW
jgi:hypothetical protein